jgi:glucose/mannose-6-phosphate isomerase
MRDLAFQAFLVNDLQLINMQILDDLKLFESRDRSGMLRLVESFPDLLAEGLECRWEIQPKGPIEKPSNVIIIGYGGSAISGDILRNWLSRRATIPIDICRDLELPAYAGEGTLAVCVSYSGETEESLKLLEAAIKAGCQVVFVTSGGIMSEICRKLNLPMVRVRGGLPPRAALPLLLSALVLVLLTFNIVGDVRGEIVQAIRELKAQVIKLRPSVSSVSNPSKKLALGLVDSMPIIYSLERMSSVARRFKDQFNENSKVPAKFDLLPEACHNEIQGWSSTWLSSHRGDRFPVMLIRDSKETADETSRLELLKEQLRLAGIESINEIKTEATTDLGRILLPINLGDFTSVYLALARGLDPTPIPAIEQLKRNLESRSGEKERIRKELIG